MHLWKGWFTLVLLIAVSGTTLAESQFFFVARVAPEGSITRAGQQEERVYLRWGLLEGSLPEDIISFSLRRDGDLLKTFPARGVMDPVQIRTLYQGATEQRRLLETVGQMKEEALLDDSLPDFDADQYASQIHNRLENDSFWAQLASRMDFNLAIARYRGWHDEDLEPGVYRYELIAHNDEGQSRRVGLADVDLTQPQQILAPTLFDQLEQSSCELPDFRDHYSVALNWAMPGANNEADRMASQLLLAGFDLYRSKTNVTSAPARDLAAEAALLDHDQRGLPPFADLERVNDTVLTITPDDNPLMPEWLETRNDLLAADLVPGDTRAYYLVPRDITGQYGPTVETLVTVRDLSRPPAPWGVRPFLNESRQWVELSFEAPTIDGYVETWGRERQFCNLLTAESDGYLEYVANDEDCATDTPRRVKMDIGDYLVYRFDSYSDASAFKDSDGDGLSDSDERAASLQCNPQTPFGGFRVSVNERTETLPSSEQVLLTDKEPAGDGVDDQGNRVNNKGEVFWYRLASRSTTGRLSLLSEPVRVNFPDRTLPDPPMVTVTQPGTEVCGCTVETQPDKTWTFISELTSPGGELTLQCDGFAPSPAYTLTPESIGGQDSSLCLDKDFLPQCSDSSTRNFIYTANNGDTFGCSLPASSGVDMCGTATVRIKANYCEAQVPAPIGVVSGPLNVAIVPLNPAHCVSLFQQVAGESVIIGTSCGTGSPSFEFEHLDGEFCGSAVTHDANNNVSASTPIGCRSIPPNSNWTLAPAQPVSLAPAGNRMALQWRLPAQVQSMVEVELTRREPAGLDPVRTRLPAVAYRGGGLQDVQLDIPDLAADTEQWCLRVRTFAPTAEIGQPRYSNWSAPLCDDRSLDTVSPPEWLPWPQLASIPEGEPLTVHNSDDIYFVGSDTGSSQILISDSLYLKLGEFRFSNPQECELPVYIRGVFGGVDTTPPDTGRYLTDLFCNNSGYARSNQVIADNLDFMVFRQARTPSGLASEFVQITPLIERVHWETVTNSKGGHLGYRLRDPFVWAFAHADPSFGERVDLVFYDRAGLVDDHDYRYQVVYFDSDKRIRQWRATEWFDYNSDDSDIEPVDGGE